MYKKIKNSSFMNIIWFLVYLLPFISILFYVLLNMNNPTNNITLEDILTQYYNSTSQGFLYDTFITIFDNYLGGEDIFTEVLAFLINWFCIVTLIHLAFDFLMLLPNICHKFMEKVGGERD